MDRYILSGIEVLRFIYGPIASNMYVLINGDEGVVVDPHMSEGAYVALEAGGVKKVTVLLTHDHPDHTSGVNGVKEKFNACLICQKNCAEIISEEKNNRPILISVVLAAREEVAGGHETRDFKRAAKPYACKADITFEKSLSLKLAGFDFVLTATPGHSRGSCCILVDGKILFTGDSLLKDTPVITRFPGSSPRDYREITLPFLRSLDRETIVLPGHQDAFMLSESRVLMGENH